MRRDYYEEMFFCLFFQLVVSFFIVFLIVFGISHYVSLGSMVASIVFPLLLTFGVFGEEIPTLIYFGYFIAFLVVFTHRMNIVRIFKGTENRMYLIPSKK